MFKIRHIPSKKILGKLLDKATAGINFHVSAPPSKATREERGRGGGLTARYGSWAG